MNHVAARFRKAQPFTFDQFLADCRSAFPKYSGAVERMSKGISVRISIIPGEAGIASVQPLLFANQYLVDFYEDGFFRRCHDELRPLLTQYYQKRAFELDVDLDLFLRMALTMAALMGFWHEMAHILRGHFVYESEVGRQMHVDWTDDPETVLAWLDVERHPVLPRRLLELDADIYAAQFTFAHVADSFRGDGRIRSSTFWTCFGLGVRGLFEVLCAGSPHDGSPGTAHPHALTRAYVALSHGIARMDKMPLSQKDAAEAIVVSTRALLEFELEESTNLVNPKELERFQQSELKLWRERSDELLPYRLAKSPRPDAA